MNKKRRNSSKMSWRYCIIRRTKRQNRKVLHFYEIREVYFDVKNRIIGWSNAPVELISESVNELRWDLSMMLADSFRMPVFEERKGKLVPRK